MIWLPMCSAPKGPEVWLTDGEKVFKARWTDDVHGRPGWFDGHSFAHFRTWEPRGWMPRHKPSAPNWTKKAIA